MKLNWSRLLKTKIFCPKKKKNDCLVETRCLRIVINPLHFWCGHHWALTQCIPQNIFPRSNLVHSYKCKKYLEVHQNAVNATELRMQIYVIQRNGNITEHPNDV